jgi:hypothetical protein
MTDESLCCDLEHAKLLAETGLLRLEDADGVFLENVFYDHYEVRYIKLYASYCKIVKMPGALPTFRLDKVVAMLPDQFPRTRLWSYDTDMLVAVCNQLSGRHLDNESLYRLREALQDVVNYANWDNTIQRIANAAAKLLHLLWEEKLI